MNVLICGPKALNISGILDAISPRYIRKKSWQHVCACDAHDGAICPKNRKIVPYHRDSRNTRNGARLRSPSPIMAPGLAQEHSAMTLAGLEGPDRSTWVQHTKHRGTTAYFSIEVAHFK